MTVGDASRKDEADAAIELASRGFLTAANRLPTLWQLSTEFDVLLALLEEPDQDLAAIDAEMQRVAGDIVHKAHGVAAVIQSLQKLAEWQKGEMRRMAERAKASEAHADRLKAYALACMKVIEQPRIETGTFTLSIRANPPHVDVLNEPVLARVEGYETMPDEVPGEFVRQITVYKVDKRAITAYVKATGEVVPGCELVRTESLSIR